MSDKNITYSSPDFVARMSLHFRDARNIAIQENSLHCPVCKRTSPQLEKEGLLARTDGNSFGCGHCKVVLVRNN